MKNDIGKDCIAELTNDDVPMYEIIDPFGYISSNRIIAHIRIKGTKGEQIRELVRTKKGGYIMYS
jgi:hypothetical protein